MAKPIFFSWQVDTPSKEGRNLIERALERAISRIGEDTTLEEAVRELVVDRDTKGVSGSPPIVDTIFRKIENSAVFVPDLTFVGARRDGRPTPNPNVLIEYGWALRSLGHARIVPVMNTAFGKPLAESMPFDLRHLRNPILYECSGSTEEETRRRSREALARELEMCIRDVLASDEYRASIPNVAGPPPFIEEQAKDGQARFRPKGSPVGIAVDGAIGSQHVQVMLTDGPAAWLRLLPSGHPGRR